MKRIELDRQATFEETSNFQEYKEKLGILNESEENLISERLWYEQKAWESGPHFVMESGVKIPGLGSKISGRKTLNGAAKVSENWGQFKENVAVMLEELSFTDSDWKNLKEQWRTFGQESN